MGRWPERKIGLDAEMCAAPIAQGFHEGNQFFAFVVEGLGYLWRTGVSDTACQDAVGHELAQLITQDFFRNFREPFA